MKKIFSGILGIFTIFFLVFSQSFAVILSFVAKDGSMFCETDNFDGQYILCSAEKKVLPNLGQSGRYGPQLVETPQAKICVEKGKEVDGSLCGIEKLKDKISTDTGILMENQSGAKNISNTGDITATVVPLTGSTDIGMNTNTDSVAASVALIGDDNTDNVYISNASDIIQSLRTSFLACTGNLPDTVCALDSLRIMTSVENIGLYLIGGIFLFLCFCCIFWWMMFIHVLSNPVSHKIAWITAILIFSIFGAVAYYFIVNRPYVAAQLALLPPKPPSFFD